MKARLNKTGTKVLCGRPRCAVLGEVIQAGNRVLWVSLLEGYRQEPDGVYRMHSHALRRYRGSWIRAPLPPKDAHWRWVGAVEVPGDPTAFRWGPGGTDLHYGELGLAVVPRERMRYRERAADGAVVVCPSCGFSSVLAFATAEGNQVY